MAGQEKEAMSPESMITVIAAFRNGRRDIECRATGHPESSWVFASHLYKLAGGRFDFQDFDYRIPPEE